MDCTSITCMALFSTLVIALVIYLITEYTDTGKLERLTGLFGKDKLAELMNHELDAAYADPFAEETTTTETKDTAKEGEG